jgi:hypothetical protein
LDCCVEYDLEEGRMERLGDRSGREEARVIQAKDDSGKLDWNGGTGTE